MTRCNLRETIAFLRALGKSETTFQTFDDAKSGRVSPRIFHGYFSDHAGELSRENSAGAGIFAMVNHGDGKGRREENVRAVVALFADFDGVDPDPAIAALPPHVVVETSSGKFHCYWRVADCALPMFSMAQRAIAAQWGSDPVVKDLPRVMRLPGFFHRKATPFLVQLVSVFDGPSYSLAQIVEDMKLDLSAHRQGHGVPPAKHQPCSDDTWGPAPAYSKAALDAAARRIVGAPIGQQDMTFNAEAYSIGQLVAGGAMPRAFAADVLERAGMAMVNGDIRRPWTVAIVRKKIQRAFSDAAAAPRCPALVRRAS